MEPLEKLTDTQCNFAAEQHDLVNQFLHLRGLSEDAYYDIVIFGYLRAVQLYGQRPELREYSFQALAFKRMRAVLWNHFRSLRAEKRNTVVLSFHDPARAQGYTNRKICRVYHLKTAVKYAM